MLSSLKANIRQKTLLPATVTAWFSDLQCQEVKRCRKAPLRFAAAVSYDEEQKQRNTAIPEKTKCVTDWGIHVWSEWAANRSSSSHDR